jgi:hypothetical protein
LKTAIKEEKIRKKIEIMNTKGIILIAICLVSLHCFAQNNKTTDVTDITKVNFFSPGLGYEKRIGKFQTLHAQAFAALSSYLAFSGDNGPGVRAGLYLDPAAAIGYRYYYNYAQREAKGKRTEMNSLNYIGPVFQTVFSNANISAEYLTEEKRRAINLIGLSWGLQRNYSKRFSLDLNFGAGYLFAKSTETVSGQRNNKEIGKPTTTGHLTLGFWINKRKETN